MSARSVETATPLEQLATDAVDLLQRVTTAGRGDGERLLEEIRALLAGVMLDDDSSVGSQHYIDTGRRLLDIDATVDPVVGVVRVINGVDGLELSCPVEGCPSTSLVAVSTIEHDHDTRLTMDPDGDRWLWIWPDSRSSDGEETRLMCKLNRHRVEVPSSVVVDWS